MWWSDWWVGVVYVGILGWCYGFMGTVVRLVVLDGVAVGLKCVWNDS